MSRDFPLRSPRDTVGGITVFGRILDKIRLHASDGALPEGYHLGVISGRHTFDDRVCRFLHVEFEALRMQVLAGGTDEEVLEWCFENGRRPNPEEIEVWNGFMSKRGWRDDGAANLTAQKDAAGFGDREDIATFFDLMDAEEGRGGSS
jgi:gluconokinase